MGEVVVGLEKWCNLWGAFIVIKDSCIRRISQHGSYLIPLTPSFVAEMLSEQGEVRNSVKIQ